MTSTAMTAPAACAESGCTAPLRRLLRYAGGTYLSDWCWEHGCRCLVCGGEIDDGEDFCAHHAEALGVRYETDLPEDLSRMLHAPTLLPRVGT